MATAGVLAVMASPLRVAHADEPMAPAKALPTSDPTAFTEHQLDNGLVLLVGVDRRTPSVAIAAWYPAGSALDPASMGGTAALAARVAREREGVGPSDARRPVVGARVGAVAVRLEREGASFSRTAPKTELRLALWAEAQRMRPRTVGEEEVARHRDALAREAAAESPLSAEGRVRGALEAMVYQGVPAYAHPPDGDPESRARITPQTVAEFMKTAYRPNGAVIAIVGDVEPERVLAVAREELGALTAVAANVAPAVSLPVQINQRSNYTLAPDAVGTRVDYAWAGPVADSSPTSSRELASLEAGLAILTLGRGARLDTLVREGLAVAASGALHARRSPSLLTLTVEVSPSAEVRDVREWTQDAIAELATDPPSPSELERAERALALARASRVDDPLARARAAAEGRALAGAPAAPRADAAAVTPVSVRDAVAKHLAPLTRSVLEVRPTRPPPAPPRATARAPREGPHEAGTSKTSGDGSAGGRNKTVGKSKKGTSGQGTSKKSPPKRGAPR